MTLYLAKDNNELVSFCECDQAYTTYPPQMDCPWCGCGWLFSCTKCRKAFTFARAIDVPETLEEIGRRDLKAAWGKEPSKKDVTMWAESMKVLLEDVELGGQYVVLDGVFIETSYEAIEFGGWHSEHKLDFIPQVAALEDPQILRSVLESTDYWMESKLTEDE